jgi:hypothetical protein
VACNSGLHLWQKKGKERVMIRCRFEDLSLTAHRGAAYEFETAMGKA